MYSEKFKIFIDMWREEFAIERSINEKVCLDRDNNPIPWYTYPAIEYLSQFDYSNKEIFPGEPSLVFGADKVSASKSSGRKYIRQTTASEFHPAANSKPPHPFSANVLKAAPFRYQQLRQNDRDIPPVRREKAPDHRLPAAGHPDRFLSRRDVEP